MIVPAVEANPDTVVPCIEIELKIICRFKKLKDKCHIPDNKCKRERVSFYNDVPSLEISQKQGRESSNYNYNHIYG